MSEETTSNKIEGVEFCKIMKSIHGREFPHQNRQSLRHEFEAFASAKRKKSQLGSNLRLKNSLKEGEARKRREITRRICWEIKRNDPKLFTEIVNFLTVVN